MSRETTPALSSQQFGNDLGEILEHKASALDQAQNEVDALRDTPAVLAREHQAAYHEVFYDNDAKELLWQAEHMIPGIMAQTEEMYLLAGLREESLMIDVIEAYGSVVPDEGLRLLDEMPDSSQKVGALARFGRVTDPVFIAEARMMAVKLQQDGSFYDQGDLLFAVAHYGNDDTSLDIAYREVVHAYENPVRVRTDGSGSDYNDWHYVENLCKLASLGHKPALQRAKAAIIHGSTLDHGVDEHSIEEAALVEYIDELLQRGNIGQRVGVDADNMVSYEATEQAWQNFVLNNKDRVIEVLKKGVELPRFDSLSKDFGMFQYHIQKNTSLSTIGQTMAYVDAQAGSYADILEQHGSSGIKLAWGESTQLDKKYLHSRDDIKAGHDETVAMLKHNGWGHFISKGGVETAIARTDKEAADIIGFLNNLALLRSMTIAAVYLTENPVEVLALGPGPEPG